MVLYITKESSVLKKIVDNLNFMQNKNTINPASLLILKKDNKVLLTRKCKEPFSGFYTLPSGKVDEGETFTDAVIRESEEEVGVILSKDDLRVAHIVHRNEDDGSGVWVDAFFVAEKWKGEIENKETNKCDDLNWFDINNLPENIVPFVKSAIENVNQRVCYSEFGWNKK